MIALGSPPNLTDLRNEIDQIDQQIHDLIMHRASIVEHIMAAKGSSPNGRNVLRPGREAIILRHLLSRHHGRFPRDAIGRIWREIISGFCRLQGPFSIAVLATEKSVGFTELARAHYGSGAPLSLFRSGSRVLRQVAEGSGTIGVLPAPEEGEIEPWWPQLAEGEGEVPKVIARLPFVPQSLGQMENLIAYAVALTEPEPSGDDESLLSLRLAGALSRARLMELISKVGLQARGLATRTAPGGGELQLYAITGFVTDDDPRLNQLLEISQGAIARAKILGTYALPISQ